MVFTSRGFGPGSAGFLLMNAITVTVILLSVLAFIVLLVFEVYRSVKVRVVHAAWEDCPVTQIVRHMRASGRGGTLAHVAGTNLPSHSCGVLVSQFAAVHDVARALEEEAVEAALRQRSSGRRPTRSGQGRLPGCDGRVVVCGLVCTRMCVWTRMFACVCVWACVWTRV